MAWRPGRGGQRRTETKVPMVGLRRACWVPGLAAFAVFAASLGASGCGREAGPATAAIESEGIAVSGIALPGRTFTLDDVVAAGWKRSRRYETDTLPRAKEVWYGFFNQRDIEVRVYGSHAEAVEHGTGPAAEAIERRMEPGAQWILVPQLYHAYMIVGNLVMLCEMHLGDCEALVEKME